MSKLQAPPGGRRGPPTSPATSPHIPPPSIGAFNVAGVGFIWWVAMAILFSFWTNQANRAKLPGEFGFCGCKLCPCRVSHCDIPALHSGLLVTAGLRVL